MPIKLRSRYLTRYNGSKYPRPICHKDGTISFYSIVYEKWYKNVNWIYWDDLIDFPKDEQERLMKSSKIKVKGNPTLESRGVKFTEILYERVDMFMENKDGVHLMSSLNSEYSICGDACDVGSEDGCENMKGTSKSTVTCKRCILEIRNCRNVSISKG